MVESSGPVEVGDAIIDASDDNFSTDVPSMDESIPGATYSISFRLSRVTAEYDYVNVPIVDEVVEFDQDGVGRIDPSALTRLALEMGQDPRFVRYWEGLAIEPHPLQESPGEGESRFPS